MSNLYTITTPGLTNMIRGVFSNITKVFEVFDDYKKKGCKVRFDGAIGFDDKAYNYKNILNLVKGINNGESFGIILDDGNKEKLYEITKTKKNLLLI